MSKGIIRILEAIIASVIILTAMTFFFTAKFRPQAEENFIFVQAYDAVRVMDVKGDLSGYVKNNDAESMTNAFYSMFPSTLDFSIEVTGIANPKIYVACNCTPDDFNDIRNILQPLSFYYKQRRIEILVDTTSLSPIKEGSDVLLFMDYVNLNANKDEINAFLDNGGTVFFFTSLSQPEVEDGFLNETFGLAWTSSAAGSTGTFATTTDPKNHSTRFFRYYDNITEDFFADASPLAFEKFSPGTNIETGYGTVVIDGDFSNAYVKAFDSIGTRGSGRFVWFNSYDSTVNDNETIIMNNLLKASIMWASGERFSMDFPAPRAQPEKRVQVHYIVTNSNDLYFEPFEVILTVWRIFF